MLAQQAVAGQLNRLGSGRWSLLVPVVRQPFEPHEGLHLHQFFELAIQCCGASRWQMPDEWVRVPAGAMLLFPRGAAHSEHLDEPLRPNCNVNIYVSQEASSYHLLSWIDERTRRVSADAVLHPAGHGLVFDMLSETVAACERQGTASPLVRGLLLATLSMLAENIAGAEEAPEAAERLVRLCRQEALRHLSSVSLNVAWLADHLACNADHLSHQFSLRTGRRLNAFINDERVKLARYLLQSSTLDIAEVALSCGYADPGYFARVFRRSCGTTPGRFRRSALPAEQPG
jgi:AraC-like DNA-binding protein